MRVWRYVTEVSLRYVTEVSQPRARDLCVRVWRYVTEVSLRYVPEVSQPRARDLCVRVWRTMRNCHANADARETHHDPPPHTQMFITHTHTHTHVFITHTLSLTFITHTRACECRRTGSWCANLSVRVRKLKRTRNAQSKAHSVRLCTASAASPR